MSKQTIFLGQTANDRTGDPLRVAFEKVNENFTELYSSLGADSQIPTQATHTGKVLTTNGTTLSWSTVSYTSLTDKPTIPTSFSSLVNGAYTVSLGSTGVLTFPNGLLKIAGNKIRNVNESVGLIAGSEIEVTVDKTVISNGVTDTDTGVLSTQHIFEVGSTRIFSALQVVNSLSEGGPSLTSQQLTELDSTGFKIGYRVINDLGEGEPLTSFNGWHFGTAGVLTDAGGSFTKTTTNNLATTVLTQIVWTATETFISGAKLTIQVEANETGGTGNWETQVCEAVIAVRGYNSTSEPVMSVYGVTHTSVAPLMTFSVDRNPVSNLVEIVGTRTATATTTGNASLRIYSVETGTMD